MIELERNRDGFLKSFPIQIAQKALMDAKGLKPLGKNYWKLPEDSTHKVDKSGLIVLKAKKSKKN